MDHPAPRFTAGAWTRAARLACTAPDGGEALSRLLAEAVPALGAAAAAVLEGDQAVCRAVWACDAAALQPLVGSAGPLAAPAADCGSDEPRRLTAPPGGEGWPGGARHLLVYPLRVRGAPVGSLALFYAEQEPGERVAEVAAGFAALAALVLENDRLYEEAREAQQARDHFLTALNHELRTPATAFVLTADLLRCEPPGTLPARLERLLRDADAHLQQLMGVLRRVLDLGQLGDHANPESADVLHPRQAVAELMRRVEPMARRKNLSLSLYVPRGLAPVQTDGSRFSRILLHLLSNAIKYTAHGGIEVRLERASLPLSRTRPEPVLMVHVRDTGLGIPPHQLERIFEPFTQVEEGARSDSASRGHGLGLPLARRLARSLGGDVRIESALGTGTTATLLLPYHPRAPEPA